MFIWVTQGIVEPYTPKVKQDSIKKVNPLHSGIPEKPLEENEPVDSIQIHYRSGGGGSNNPSIADYYSKEEAKLKEDRKLISFARDIMAGKPIYIFPEDPITKVENLFNTHRVRHMPVVNSSLILQGILSERDLLKHTIDILRSFPLEPKKDRVMDIMQTRVLSAFPETPIRDLARLMYEEKVGSVPILNKEDSKLIGIVTRGDILRIVMHNPPIDLYT